MGFLDLAFGAHEALRECRFGKEKGFGDFRSAEAAERSEREGNLSFLIKRRVAAGKDQAQPVVG